MQIIKNQQGITTSTVIGFIVILVIIGFTGWRVMEANKAIDENKVVSNSPTKESKTDANETPSVPEGYVEYSKNNLTFYYPDTQQPAKDTTATFSKETPSVLSAVALKDYNIAMYDAKDLQLQMGIGAPWVCNYNADASTFTLNKAKSFEGIASNACDKFNKKTALSGIEFNNLSTGYESRIVVSYAAPTKDKKYLIKISNTRDDVQCYQAEVSPAECTARADKQLKTLEGFVASFADVNEVLFK